MICTGLAARIFTVLPACCRFAPCIHHGSHLDAFLRFQVCLTPRGYHVHGCLGLPGFSPVTRLDHHYRTTLPFTTVGLPRLPRWVLCLPGFRSPTCVTRIPFSHSAHTTQDGFYYHVHWVPPLRFYTTFISTSCYVGSPHLLSVLHARHTCGSDATHTCGCGSPGYRFCGLPVHFHWVHLTHRSTCQFSPFLFTVLPVYFTG